MIDLLEVEFGVEFGIQRLLDASLIIILIMVRKKSQTSA